MEIKQNDNTLTLCNQHTNWNKFRDIIESKINVDISLESNEDLDEAVEHLTRTIQTAAWESTPAKLLRSSKQRQSNEVENAIKHKRKLRKMWMTTKSSYDKQKFNAAAKKFKELIRAERNLAFQDFLRNLTSTEDTNYSL